MPDHVANPTKILLIEDHDLSRDLVSRRLAKRGYAVIEAEDGRRGLELAERERPDLVVLDLGLPEVDGWEVARRLKASADLKHIPILVLTAHAQANQLEQARAAGCEEIETKPLTACSFLDKVEKLLERKVALEV